MSDTLLPPNATALERALAAGVARVSDVPMPLAPLWDPATCPADVLPWMAWGLSVDTWDADWPEAAKRTAIANAIAIHRRKGTRFAVETVLAQIDALATVIEWHETTPRGTPHTFEIHVPIDAASGARATATAAEAIVREIGRVKPLREHLTVVQRLAASGMVGVEGAARLANYIRSDAFLTIDTSRDWPALLQTDLGEPLEDGTGSYLDTTP